MIDNGNQHSIMVALIAIHKERIQLYERLMQHIPDNRIKLRSALEDIIAQARMFKQTLIEALTGYGEVSDISNESDRPTFYEVWCTRVEAIRDKSAELQLIHIEQALQQAYEQIQITQLLNDSFDDMLQSQRAELDYNVTKLHLIARKAADER